jgi:Cdc6-like AAA superfamily ATPase
MTQDERIAKIRGGRWIRYARAEYINGRLDDLLQRPKSHRMPNLLIVGDTDNGKTALVNRFLAQHQPQAASDGTTPCIPIISVQAPPLPDERRFYQAILSKVFAPFRPSRTAANLQFETVQLLASVGVKMLIIDEIQHVLAGPTQRAADSDRGGRNARCVQRRPDGPATCEPV